MNVIVIDGISGSGKSTLKKALEKRLNYDVLVIDRFTPSFWVYDMLRGIDRTKEVQEFELNKFQLLDPLVIILFCSEFTSRKRDVIDEVVFSYKQELEMFEKYIDSVSRMTSWLFTLNTDLYSKSECVNKVLWWLEKKNEGKDIRYE